MYSECRESSHRRVPAKVQAVNRERQVMQVERNLLQASWWFSSTIRVRREGKEEHYRIQNTLIHCMHTEHTQDALHTHFIHTSHTYTLDMHVTHLTHLMLLYIGIHGIPRHAL